MRMRVAFFFTVLVAMAEPALAQAGKWSGDVPAKGAGAPASSSASKPAPVPDAQRGTGKLAMISEVAYDPLAMGLNLRGAVVSSTLGKIDIRAYGGRSGPSQATDLEMTHESLVSVRFSSAGGSFPRGTYSVGIELEATGQLPAGRIAISQGQTFNSATPMVGACPIRAGTQRCTAKVALDQPAYFWVWLDVKHSAGDGYSSPALRKIVVSTP